MSRRQAGRRAGLYLAAFGAILAMVVTGGTLAERASSAAVRGEPGPDPSAVAGWTDPQTTGAGPAAQPVPPTQAPGSSPLPRYVFPVGASATYARTHHDYPAADVVAACGSPVRSVTDGIVLEVSRVDRYSAAVDDGAARGGLFVSILGDDGVRYYGSHLRSVEAGINAGVRVDAGDLVGTVGDTGHAGACHLHFGISPTCGGTGDWWIRRGVVWPWPYLDSWRVGRRSSPADEVAAWRAAHGCPPPP